LERFFGILIENSAGEFPFWLSPVQLRLLPVVDEVVPYCQQIQRLGQQAGIRVEIDTSQNRLGKQIRSAELEKIPLTAIVGLHEMQTNGLSLRIRKLGDIGTYTVSEIFTVLQELVQGNEELHGDKFAHLVKILPAVAAATTSSSSTITTNNENK